MRGNEKAENLRTDMSREVNFVPGMWPAGTGAKRSGENNRSLNFTQQEKTVLGHQRSVMRLDGEHTGGEWGLCWALA